MYYIGKKQYVTKTRAWKTYKSSSRILKEEIKEDPKNFKYIIIEQYKSTGGLSWAEIYTQVSLETPNDRNSFNFYISKIRGKAKERVTPGHKRYIKYFKNKYLSEIDNEGNLMGAVIKKRRIRK